MLYKEAKKMVRSLRYDRIVESSIHARVQPTHIGPVNRVSRPVSLRATREHVSENDLIAYGYALHKENHSSTSHKLDLSGDHPLDALKRLSIHSKTLPLYHYITDRLPHFLQTRSNERIPTTTLHSDELNQLGSMLKLNQHTDAQLNQPLRGLAIDHYC